MASSWWDNATGRRYRLLVTAYRLPVAVYLLTGCRLPVASLPVAR
jgi:hypothetical protein